jgi:hypothetical protein
MKNLFRKMTIVLLVLCLGAPLFAAAKTKTMYVTLESAPL